MMDSAENWRRWAGLNLAGGGIDEACNLKDDGAWRMLLSRLRDGNHISAWTSSTPEGFNWHYDYWADEPKEGYDLIQGRTMDNTFLPQEYIDTLYDNYDERMVKAYIEGQYVNLQRGQTYYGFKRDKNIGRVEYNPNQEVYVGMDFNVEPITATLLQCYTEEPRIRVFDEIALKHSGGNELLTERLGKEIKRRTGINANLKNKIKCYPDPSGKNRHTSSLATDHDILRQMGFDVRVKRSAPAVIDRVNAVNKIMESCIIDPKCKGFIRDLEQTNNKEGTREIDKSDKSKTHFTDGFGYFVEYEYPVRKPITRTFNA